MLQYCLQFRLRVRRSKKVLDIWNQRVSNIRAKFAHVRTIVLVKKNDLSEFALFEFETVRYDAQDYEWKWNESKSPNLEGWDKSGKHVFTWQPSGSQFTIIEPVPESRIAFRVRIPDKIDTEFTLSLLGFDNSWVTIL